MPRKYTVAKSRRRSRRAVRGGSLLSWIKNKALPWVKKKAVPWLKKHKVLSKAGSFLGSAGVPYAGDLGKVAGVLGYGKRRGAKKIKYMRGRGLGATGNGKKKASRRR